MGECEFIHSGSVVFAYFHYLFIEVFAKYRQCFYKEIFYDNGALKHIVQNHINVL